MSDPVTSLAFRGTAPWHGLGVNVSEDATVEDILKHAGLDWAVDKEQNYLKVKGVEADGETARTVSVPVKGSYALVRSDNTHILSRFVGSRYNPIQNSDAFKIFQDFVDAGDMVMETAGSLHEGETIWGLASIKDGFELAGGDEIKGYMLVSQSHKYGTSMRAMFTPVRTVDFSTMLEGARSGYNVFRMAHSRLFNDERLREVKEVMGLARRKLEDFQKKAEFLSQIVFSEEQGARFLLKVFNPTLLRNAIKDKRVLPKTLDELAIWDDADRVLKRMPEVLRTNPGANLESARDGTGWGYVTAVNHYFDHVHGRSVDTRLNSAWFGQNAKKKQAALREALNIANTGDVAGQEKEAA